MNIVTMRDENQQKTESLLRAVADVEILKRRMETYVVDGNAYDLAVLRLYVRALELELGIYGSLV